MSGMETGPGTNPYINKPAMLQTERCNRKSSLLLMEEIRLAIFKCIHIYIYNSNKNLVDSPCLNGQFSPFLPSTGSKAPIHAFEQKVVDRGTSTWSPLASDAVENPWENASKKIWPLRHGKRPLRAWQGGWFLWKKLTSNENKTSSIYIHLVKWNNISPTWISLK